MSNILVIIKNLTFVLSLSGQWRIQDFPEVGAPTLQGAPTYDFAKFPQKPHEIERICIRGWEASLVAPLDLSLLVLDLSNYIKRQGMAYHLGGSYVSHTIDQHAWQLYAS